MRLAFSKPTCTEEEQHRLFTRFRDAGYEGLQLKHGQYGRYLNDPQQFLDRWGSIPGVAEGLICGGSLDEAGQAGLRSVVRYAAAVGSERVIFCHSRSRDGLTDDDIREYARILSEIGHEARAEGIALSLHNHYGQPGMHREEIDLFFQTIGDAAVSLTLDTAHLVKSGVTDIAGVIRDWHCAIGNVHLKDYADRDFAMLGEGQIDFVPVFSALHEVGYGGWLCADEESGSDLDHALAESHAFMTRFQTVAESSESPRTME